MKIPIRFFMQGALVAVLGGGVCFSEPLYAQSQALPAIVPADAKYKSKKEDKVIDKTTPAVKKAVPEKEKTSDQSTPNPKETKVPIQVKKEPEPKQASGDVKNQAKAFRKERAQKMPYLDSRIIEELITPREIREKIDFTESKERKSLDDVIRRAIHSNTPARAVLERVALARRKILVAMRNLFPEGSLEYTTKDGLLGNISGNADREADAFTHRSYRLKFRQPIFHGGILWNTLLQSKAELEAAQNSYDMTVGELIKDVSKAFFDMNRAKQQALDYGDALEALRPLRDIAAKKFQENLVSEIENLNAQSLYGEMEYQRETARQELELAKLELQKLLNLSTQDDFDIRSLYDAGVLIVQEDKNRPFKSLADQGIFSFQSDPQGINIENLVDLAYQNRPELRVESAKLEAARMGQKIRWAKMLPQVDATVEFGGMGEMIDANTLTGKRKLREEFRFMLEMSWNVGGNKLGYSLDNDERAPSETSFYSRGGEGSDIHTHKFTVGFLDGLQDFVDMKQADVQKLEQVIELEKAEKKVMQDVKQAYFDFQKSQIQVRSLIQKVNYRKRVADVKKHELDKNEAQISDYLQMESELMEELSRLHKAIADYLSARASLNYAIGDPDYLKFGEKYEFGK